MWSLVRLLFFLHTTMKGKLSEKVAIKTGTGFHEDRVTLHLVSLSDVECL